MSIRIVLAVLITAVIMLVPVAFLLGRRQAAPPPVVQPAPAVAAVAPPAVAPAPGQDAAPTATTPPPAREPEHAGGDLFSSLVSAVGNRVADDARKVVDKTVDDAGKEISARLDESTARLERDLADRLNKGRDESEHAARKLGDDLDQRTAALTRATSEQSARLNEQVEATAKAGRVSADAISKTSADLRTLVSGTVISFNAQADQSKAKLVALAKEAKDRSDKLVGKVGIALPGTAARLSNELAATWQHCFDEIDRVQAGLQQQTAAAHQRYTDTVGKAQAEAEQQRLKALALVQGASDALHEQVATAQRELTDAVKRAQQDASQGLSKTMAQAEQRPDPHGEPARGDTTRKGSR